MKRILIISPNFPPVNAADMHRVRQSLPYLNQFGWAAEVICVDPAFVEAYSIDELLLQGIPGSTIVHRVKAWHYKATRKFGLGSLSIRSFYHIRKKGNELLKTKKFALVFFSTTAFHVMALGPYWRKKFGLPFILDIQDPWRRDFYLDKPKSERPPKFWLNYQLDKYLERKTVPKADGILSVSRGYCDMFQQRYEALPDRRFEVLPLGGSVGDFDTMRKTVFHSSFSFSKDLVNMVYIGRGGHDLKKACTVLFKAVLEGKEEGLLLFDKLYLWFLGTSYAPPGQGSKTIEPIARELGLHTVTEVPDRIPYFESLFLLEKADLLFVPGSTDVHYTASKIFPYILAQKPLMALFNSQSLVHKILANCNSGHSLLLDEESEAKLVCDCKRLLQVLISPSYKASCLNEEALYQYSSEGMTEKQVKFFDKIIQLS